MTEVIDKKDFKVVGRQLIGNDDLYISSEPLVSIITVCLNSEETLEQCITSVVNQDYNNIEYLVIDGGSSDSSVEIIKKHSHQISYFVSEPDNGLYHAMNKGIAVAKGEYILFLNSDDWYEPDCVSKLLEAKKSSGADFVSALARYVDNRGETVNILRSMPYDHSIRLRMPLRHETMLVPTYIYKRLGKYNEDYKIISDLEYAIRLYDAGYTNYEISEPLLNFRNTGISNSDKELLLKEKRSLLKEVFPFLEDNDSKLLANLHPLNPEDLLTLVKKYSNQELFISSLLNYYEDRVSINKQWAASDITFPSSMNDVKISVILATYNAAEYLKSCMESLVNQTLDGIEFICIDDCSADLTFEMLQEYEKEHPSIKAYQNKTNVGLGTTRNRGVELSEGQYIFHIDPDDQLPLNSLEKLYNTAITYKSEMVKGRYVREQHLFGKEQNKSISKNFCVNDVPIENVSLKTMPELLNTTEGHWSFLYLNDFARSVKYPTDLKMGQDSIFLVNAIVGAKRISLIAEIVYHYRTNVTSAMNRFTYQKFIDAIEWRKRAWYVLKFKGYDKIGGKFPQTYWSVEFFKMMIETLKDTEIQSCFDTLKNAFLTVGLPGAGNTAPQIIQELFTFILNDEYKHAVALIRADI